MSDLGPVQFLLIGVCIAATVGLIWAERGIATGSAGGALRWVFKPLASACFVLLAVTLGALGSEYGTYILAGLVFCMLGDILLIPAAEVSFKAGVGAFALGHILFSFAFLSLGVSLGPAILMTVAGALLAGFFIWRWLYPHLVGADKYLVSAYVVIILAMVVLSVGAMVSRGAGGWAIALAAITFAVSDIAVSREKFVKSAFLNRLWGLPTYFGAQLLLATTV